MFMLAILGVVALIAITSLWRGFVLVKLWSWFIVPVFHLPLLTYAPAIGLSLVVGFLVYQYHSDEADQRPAGEKFTHACIISFIYPLIVLMIGWVVSLCM